VTEKDSSKNTSYFTVFLFLLFILTLFLLQFLGLSNRKYTNQKVVKIREEKQVLNAWLKNNVKGRVLLHFSRHLPVQEANLDQLNSRKKIIKIATNQNYLFVALRLGLIRKIVAVIPNNYWPSLRIKLQNSQVYVVNNNYASGWLDTVPITILPAAFLPQIKEKVLITKASSYPTKLAQFLTALKKRKINYDIFVWQN
jgi:hypothetical protein